jgi:hypothetical protein
MLVAWWVAVVTHVVTGIWIVTATQHMVKAGASDIVRFLIHPDKIFAL